MLSRIFYIILGLFFVFGIEAQNIEKYKIQLSIPTRSFEKVYLGQYWAGQRYAIDSVQLSDKGYGVFSLNKKLDPGQYFLYIRPDFQTELLIDEGQKNIRISIDERDISQSKVSGSKDTELLWGYIIQKRRVQQLDSILEKKYDEASISEKIEIENKLKSIAQANEKSWYEVFTKGLTPISLPHIAIRDSSDYIENERYRREHYFDNIDLTDPRMWRTSYLTNSIDNYINDGIYSIPDSLAMAATEVVERTKSNAFCYKEILTYVMNKSLRSARMGDENIWAKLYEDYISGKNITWIDSIQMLELQKKYETIKYNRIGMKARNLTLETIEGGLVNTNEIQADYLIMYFYNHTCNHCMDELPQIYALYKTYKDKGLNVITIDINNDKKAAKDFINTYKFNDWINCIDPDYKSQFWMYYDTSYTPATLILDKNKTIVAKNIDKQNIEQFLKFYLDGTNGTN